MPGSGPDTNSSARILGEFPDQGPVREFAGVVSECESDLLAYRSAVTDVQISPLGLSTVRLLDDIEEEHDQVIRRITELRDACIEESLSPVSDIETDGSADRKFRSYVRNGVATEAVESLDETAARIDHQIENKRTVAVARLSLVVAVASLLVSVLLLISSGVRLL